MNEELKAIHHILELDERVKTLITQAQTSPAHYERNLKTIRNIFEVIARQIFVLTRNTHVAETIVRQADIFSIEAEKDSKKLYLLPQSYKVSDLYIMAAVRYTPIF